MYFLVRFSSGFSSVKYQCYVKKNYVLRHVQLFTQNIFFGMIRHFSSPIFKPIVTCTIEYAICHYFLHSNVLRLEYIPQILTLFIFYHKLFICIYFWKLSNNMYFVFLWYTLVSSDHYKLHSLAMWYIPWPDKSQGKIS